MRKIVAHDLLPYGIRENISTIDVLEATTLTQRIRPRRLSMAEMFVDPQRS